MKKYLLLSIIFACFVTIFSIQGVAQNTSDTQVSIRIRNLGLDISTGGTTANITITTNKIGDMTYVEEYYSVDSYGQPKFCCDSRHEVIMKDYIVSFDLKRPDHDHWQKWSSVNSKILLDREIIYYARTGISGNYKSPVPEISSNTSNSVTSAGRIKSGNQRITQQFVDIVHEDNNTNGMINIRNIRPMYNVTIIEGTSQKVPMIGIPVGIILILSVYIFKRINM